MHKVEAKSFNGLFPNYFCANYLSRSNQLGLVSAPDRRCPLEIHKTAAHPYRGLIRQRGEDSFPCLPMYPQLEFCTYLFLSLFIIVGTSLFQSLASPSVSGDCGGTGFPSRSSLIIVGSRIDPSCHIVKYHAKQRMKTSTVSQNVACI